MIKEFPWNMECKVINRIELGTHVCYFGKVVATHSDPKYIKTDSLDPEKFHFPAYIAGNYLEIKSGTLEKHGFSIE